MTKVYIAGKLNDMAVDYVKNLHEMCHWANEVRIRGFSVFVPGIDFMMGFMFGNWEYDDYFVNNQEWLEASDVVFVCPGFEQSEGVQREIELANDREIPVCFSIEELEEYL